MENSISQLSRKDSQAPEGSRQKRGHVASNFIQCVYRMVEGEHAHKVVHWSPTTDSFIAQNCEGLIRVLPKYFKTRNYTSFVRQLNMYGFHKVKGGAGFSEFRHPHFRQNRPDLLYLIKRKLPGLCPEKLGAAGQFFNGEISKLKAKLAGHRAAIAAEQAEHARLTKEVRAGVQTAVAQRSAFSLKIKRALFLLYLGGMELLPGVAETLKQAALQAGLVSADDRQRLFAAPDNLDRVVKELQQRLEGKEDWLNGLFNHLLDVLIPQLRKQGSSESEGDMDNDHTDAELAFRMEAFVRELAQQLASRGSVGALARSRFSDFEDAKFLRRCETLSTKDADSEVTPPPRAEIHNRRIRKQATANFALPLVLKFTKSAGSRVFSEPWRAAPDPADKEDLPPRQSLARG